MFDDRDMGWVFDSPARNTVTRYPLTDLFVDSKENIIIDIAVAGFSREDISIEMQGDQLVISGVYNDEGRDGLQVVQEFISKQDFERKIRLHDNYIDGDISASLDNGILSIIVTKGNTVKKQISIS